MIMRIQNPLSLFRKECQRPPSRFANSKHKLRARASLLSRDGKNLRPTRQKVYRLVIVIMGSDSEAPIRDLATISQCGCNNAQRTRQESSKMTRAEVSMKVPTCIA